MKFVTDLMSGADMEKLFVFSNEVDQLPEDLEEGAKIRIYPYAISWVSDPVRPILLFQDQAKTFSLPVPMSAVEAGITMAQNSPQLPEASPHRLLEGLVGALEIKMLGRLFTEVKGHYQYAEVTYSIAGVVKVLHLRADEVVSSALAIKIPFYTTAEFVQSSRVMNTKMETLLKDPQMQLQLLKRTNTYLM